MTYSKQSAKTFIALSHLDLERDINQFLSENENVCVKKMTMQTSLNVQGTAQYLLVMILEGWDYTQSLRQPTEAKTLKDSIEQDIKNSPDVEPWQIIETTFNMAVDSGMGEVKLIADDRAQITMNDKSFLQATKAGELFVG